MRNIWLVKHLMAKNYGWTIEYIDSLPWGKFQWLMEAQRLENEMMEKQQREIERKAKQKRR